MRSENLMEKLKKHGNISETAVIGDNVQIFPHVYIGDNTTIGDNSVIQYGAFIEDDCHIGRYSRVGTNAVMRRETFMGDYSIFGSLSASEGKNYIGNHVLVHSQCHLTTGLKIDDCVFIAPLFVGANDPHFLHLRRHVKKFEPQGPHIKFGSALGVNVTVLPGVTIGENCQIGAASVVTRDIPDYSVAYGNPARVVKEVDAKWVLRKPLTKNKIEAR